MENMAGQLGSIGSNTNDIANFLNSSSGPNLAMVGGGMPMLESAAPAMCLEKFLNDPGFVERAAKFSTFNGQYFAGTNGHFGLPGDKVEMSQMLNGAMPRVKSNGEVVHSRENSSVSDPVLVAKDVNVKKRKAAPKGKGKDVALDKPPMVGEQKDSDAKRCKAAESKGNGEVCPVKPKVEQNGSESPIEDSGEKKGKGKNAKLVEPPKDYVHLRARRGQATESHSLAERVRRERISQRMKVLQDLVPGCNKVIGKALMLDEIINYVQSLQRQVEFLSMKLSAVNPQLDFNGLPNLFQKDMSQAYRSVLNSAVPLGSSAGAFSHNGQSCQGDSFRSFVLNGTEDQCSLNTLDLALSQTTSTHFAFHDGSSNAPLQQRNFWDGELPNVFPMGNGQNQENRMMAHSFQGYLPETHMKTEY